MRFFFSITDYRFLTEVSYLLKNLDIKFSPDLYILCFSESKKGVFKIDLYIYERVCMNVYTCDCVGNIQRFIYGEN